MCVCVIEERNFREFRNDQRIILRTIVSRTVSTVLSTLVKILTHLAKLINGSDVTMHIIRDTCDDGINRNHFRVS